MSAVLPASATEGTTGYLECNSWWSGGDFSVSYWFEKTATSTLRNFLSLGTVANGDNSCVKATHASTSGPTNVGVGGVVASAASSTTLTATSNTWNATAGGWHHVVLAFTASGTTVSAVDIYLDNGTVAASSLSRDAGTVAKFRVGVDFTGLAGVNAKIAQLAGFSKKLNSTEVGQLFTYYPTIIASNRVVYYPFGDAGGSTLDKTDSWTGGGTYTLVDPGTTSVAYSANEPTLSAPPSGSVNLLAGKFGGLFRGKI